MNKINKKITLFSLLTCGLLSASDGRSSSSNMDPNLGQAFESVLRQGYFPSLSSLKTYGEAVRADREAKDFIASINPKIDEYRKYFRRQSYSIILHGNRNSESEINYYNRMKEDFLAKIMDSILRINDPKIQSFKSHLESNIMGCGSDAEEKCIQYTQDHLLDILMALTSDDSKVAALGLPPVNEIKNKEEIIDQILDALAPELDQCDKDIENRLLANLINFYRHDSIVTALELPPPAQIEDKEKAINDILDIVYDSYNTRRIIDIAHNLHKNNMESIASIRRNRRNAKEFHAYFHLLNNRRDAQLEVKSLRDLLINRDNEGFRQTAAIVQSAKS